MAQSNEVKNRKEDIMSGENEKGTIGRIAFCLLFSCLIFTCLLFSQSRPPLVSFDHLSVKHGLSQNSVMAIYKDSNGYVWFGTRDGLNRYDGYTFEIFRHDAQNSTSISNNYIRTITEDDHGTIWVGTDDGLNAFNPSTQKFEVFRHCPDDGTSLSQNMVFSVLIADNGDIWVGTERGLNVKKKGTDEFLRFYHHPQDSRSLSDDHIYSLFQDSKNNIWVGTKFGGLNKYNSQINGFERLMHDPDHPNTLSNNFVRTMTEDKDGSIWVGTSNGINILKEDRSFDHIYHSEDKKNTLSNNRIRSMAFDKLGNVWIATYQGLNYFDTRNKQFKVYKNMIGVSRSLSDNSIRSLLLDGNGFLWAGTYFGGINILNPNSTQFSHYYQNTLDKKSLGYNVVGGMTEDNDGNLYLGTEGGGLYYFDRSEESFSPVESFAGSLLGFKTIKPVLYDSKRRLWVGTHLDGLCVLDFRTGSKQKFRQTIENPNGLWDDSVLSLIEDSSGKIWIGSNAGLNFFDPGSGQLVKIKLKNNLFPEEPAIYSLYEDSQKTLWIGTKTMGLIKYENGAIEHYLHDPDDPNSLGSNSIYGIHEDSDKRLWIGTYGGGLNLLNRKIGTFEKFLTKDGLVNDIVYGIKEDSNKNLWISTPSGISRFNYVQKNFNNYTPEKGLPIDELNENSAFKHSDGTIFMGGFNGLLSFRPEHIKNNLILPKVVLKELKLFNKTVTPNDPSGLLNTVFDQTKMIAFSHDHKVFTIEYGAFNYPLSGANQYAYKLQGFEDEWNYVGDKKSATYTNLDAGNYTFMVKVANDDGIWNDDIVALNILKHPPFWKTMWAYALYAALAVLLFFIVRSYLMVKLRLENSLKLEILEKKQLEKLTRLKLNFFTNISHDFRTPLTLIHGPLQDLIKHSDNTKTHGQLLLIKKNVNLMLRLINQLMDFRRMENKKVPLKLLNNPLPPFVKEIALSFQDLAKTQNIKYSFTSKFSNKKVLFDRDKLEKVLYNLLSNAFKYTPEKGEIKVEMLSSLGVIDKNGKNTDGDFVEIVVKNSGYGIEKENLEKVFDRFYQGANQETYAQPGSGIGLSLAKSLMELHKGYIKADSKVNKYTRFVIGIPLKDIYSPEDKLDTSFLKGTNGSMPEVTDTVPKKTDHKHSVLIVEDNNDLRNFLAEIFAGDYQVIKAKNGQIALSLIKQKCPSIIVSDIMMPVMSGLELCKQLKSNAKTQHIPIILVTARSSTAIELDGYDIGADDFISKPFNLEILKLKVKNLVDSKERLLKYSRKEVLLTESHINTSSSDEAFLQRLSDYVRDNIGNPDLNVNKTGKDLGLSRVHLYRKVKTITGKPPVEFIRDFRLSVAEKLVEQNKYNINEICYNVGFQDVSYFRKCFKKKYGIPASKYAERTKQELLNEATVS